MNRNYLSVGSLLALLALLAVGCGGGPSAAPTLVSSASNPNSKASTQNTASGLEPQTVEGGSVTVKVTPLALKAGAPLEFDVAMDTHSVDLAGDMLKLVILRDDDGKEYAPTAWDGPSGGGHHRAGKIKFDALAGNPKSVTLLVRNIAGVPERAFKWSLP